MSQNLCGHGVGDSVRLHEAFFDDPRGVREGKAGKIREMEGGRADISGPSEWQGYAKSIPGIQDLDPGTGH